MANQSDSPHVDVLLAGFEPFGGDASNPSYSAARAAAQTLATRGVTALALELPCVFSRTRDVLERALQEHRPRVVIACGLAAGTDRVRLERVGVNLRDARIPDNEGRQPVDEPVRSGGPGAHFTTLPVKRALGALDRAGIPAQLSLSAGSFVCNAVLYEALDLAGPGQRVGFVHVPWDAESLPDAEDAGPGGTVPALPTDQLALALVLVAEASLEPGEDVVLPGGTLH